MGKTNSGGVTQNHYFYILLSSANYFLIRSILHGVLSFRNRFLNDIKFI